MSAPADDPKRIASTPLLAWATLAVGVATVILAIGAVALAWRDVSRQTESERKVTAVLLSLDSFLAAMKEAESSQRGFLLMQEHSYLDPFLTSEPRADLELERLRSLTADDPAWRAQVDAMGPPMRTALTELKNTVSLAEDDRHEQAMAVMRLGVGKRAMDELDAIAARFEQDLKVRRLLDTPRTHTAMRRLEWFTLGGGGLLVLLTLVAARLGLRRSRAFKREELDRQHMIDFQQRLIGIIGHDVRNPLSAILATVLFLRRHGGLDEAQARAVERVGRSGERIEKIANMLLDYTHARLGHGIPVSPTVANLHEVGASVLEEFRAVQPGRALEATFEGNGVGMWDPGRLAQVLSNLVGNALKYGAPDAPVRVSVRDTAAGIRIEVHNRGTPIPTDVLPYIFEPFRRGVELDARPASGENLGLGLYIVREIVSAHGGTIRASSSEGEGTTFAVELPRQPPPPPPEPEALSPEKQGTAPRAGALKRSARVGPLVVAR